MVALQAGISNPDLDFAAISLLLWNRQWLSHVNTSLSFLHTSEYLIWKMFSSKLEYI